jgi:hypothetical protein
MCSLAKGSLPEVDSKAPDYLTLPALIPEDNSLASLRDSISRVTCLRLYRLVLLAFQATNITEPSVEHFSEKACAKLRNVGNMHYRNYSGTRLILPVAGERLSPCTPS